MDKPLLIVGGTGFIGRHLCTALSARGRSAFVVSRNPDFRFLKTCVRGVTGIDPVSWAGDAEAYFRAADTLVYLASTSIPDTFTHQPWNELSTNVQPALEVFDRALKCNPNIRVVFLSSGGTIYGSGYSSPIPESAIPRPISAYGYGKFAIEESIRFLGRSRGLRYAILRVANPVGCWQSNPGQGIVAAALRASRSGQVVKLFDGGRQVRDFLDASDLADLIIRAADAQAYNAETWNIGSGVGTTITAAIDLVERVVGRRIARETLPKRDTDLQYAVLDSTKVQRDLKWSATIDLPESIRMIEAAWNESRSARIS